MEKIIYPVWKHETESATEFNRKLLGNVSEQLIKLGAVKLRVNLVDDAVAPAEPLRIISSKPPIDGLISMRFLNL